MAPSTSASAEAGQGGSNVSTVLRRAPEANRQRGDQAQVVRRASLGPSQERERRRGHGDSTNKKRSGERNTTFTLNILALNGLAGLPECAERYYRHQLELRGYSRRQGRIRAGWQPDRLPVRGRLRLHQRWEDRQTRLRKTGGPALRGIQERSMNPDGVHMRQRPGHRKMLNLKRSPRGHPATICTLVG